MDKENEELNGPTESFVVPINISRIKAELEKSKQVESKESKRKRRVSFSSRDPNLLAEQGQDEQQEKSKEIKREVGEEEEEERKEGSQRKASGTEHASERDPAVEERFSQLPLPPLALKRSSIEGFLQKQDGTRRLSGTYMEDINKGMEDRVFQSRRVSGSYQEDKRLSRGMEGERGLQRRQTTALATTVQNILEQREELELTDGIPLYEIIKASRRLKTQKKLLEGMLFLCFILSFAVLITVLRRTSLAGETSSALLDLFLDEEFSHVNHGSLAETTPYFKKSYDDIMTQEEWWLWALGPLQKGLYPSSSTETGQFGGPPLPQGFSQLYVLGGDDGGVLVRTARADVVGCLPDELGIPQPCFEPWRNKEPNKASFGHQLPDDPFVSQAFQYRESGLPTKLEGTFLGRLLVGKNNYGPNGFFIDLPANNAGNKSVETLFQLFDNNWLDQQTRVVSVEFNLYNPVTRVVSAVRLFTEFSHTGMVRPSYRLYHMNAIMWHDAGVGGLLLALLFLLLLCFFTFKWVHAFLNSPKAFHYLLRFRVVFDLLLVTLFWISTIRVALLTKESAVIDLERFQSTVQSQVFTASIFDEAELFHDIDALCSVNLMLATVKFIGYLPFQTTRTIWSTLGAAAKEITVLGIVVVLFWFGFSLGSHLTFGSMGFYEFDRIDRTFGTLMVLMFSGNVDFNALRQVSFLAAPVFYAVYMIFMWGVMLNLFVAIIVLTYERYSDVRQNFDNWAKQHHGAESGCIIMTWPELAYHHIRHTFFHLRKQTFSKEVRDLTKQPGLEMRSMHVQLDHEYLSQAMKQVISAPSGELRASVAESLCFPYRRYFREKVRQVIWLRAVKRTRHFLKMYYEDDDFFDKTFIGKWRKEFDFAKGVTFDSYSIGEMLSSFFRPMCFQRDEDSDVVVPNDKLASGDVQDDHAAKILAQSFDGTTSMLNNQNSKRRFQDDLRKSAGSTYCGSSRSVYQSKQVRKTRDALVLNELIKQEKELVLAKQAIKDVLLETQALFKNHRISFNRILRLTWNKTSNEERVQELFFDDLREILSPGCLEERRPCKMCSEEAISHRAKTLLLNYSLLKKRRQVFSGNTRLVPRYRRLGLRSKPLQFDDAQSIASSSVFNPGSRPASASFYPLNFGQ